MVAARLLASDSLKSAKNFASTLGMNDSTYSRKLASDSMALALLKSKLGDSLKTNTVYKDSVRKFINDSLKNSASITNKLLLSAVGDSITAHAITPSAIGDSIKRNRYLIIPFEKFVPDTSKTISVGTARSDTINYYKDFKGDTTIQVIATDDSSYGRYQNLAIRALIYLDSNIVLVDTVVFWFRTKFTVRDSNKVCFYAGEQSRWTWLIAYTDSSVDSNNVSWTRIVLKPTGLVGGDILALMIRGYCKGKNYNYFGNCYAVLRRK
jgi:hypothetical protein